MANHSVTAHFAFRRKILGPAFGDRWLFTASMEPRAANLGFGENAVGEGLDCGCLRVARFLAKMVPEHSGIIRALGDTFEGASACSPEVSITSETQSTLS